MPEKCCELLREKLVHTFGSEASAMQPGHGGLFPGIFHMLTDEARDPDVHIHEWLRGRVPMGITVGALFAPQSECKHEPCEL